MADRSAARFLRDEIARLSKQREVLLAAMQSTFRLLDGKPDDGAIARARKILSDAGWDAHAEKSEGTDDHAS
jgi:hypothetical protein